VLLRHAAGQKKEDPQRRVDAHEHLLVFGLTRRPRESRGPGPHQRRDPEDEDESRSDQHDPKVPVTSGI
jgi:hypothetical protein